MLSSRYSVKIIIIIFTHMFFGCIFRIYISNVNTGLQNTLPPSPRQKVRRSRRLSIDFEVTNPPQIKRHLGLRTTGQLFPTTQQENYCDWPIPKWGCLIGGGGCCIPLLFGGEIRTNTKNMVSGRKRLSN